MEWSDRINLGLVILDEVSKIMAEKDENATDELKEHMQALKQYVEDCGIDEMPPEDQKEESVSILKDVIETVFPKVFSLNAGYADAVVPEYMTLDEAKNKLMVDYIEALDHGSDELASQNINDWFDENGIVLLVPEGNVNDGRKKGVLSSSSSESGKTMA